MNYRRREGKVAIIILGVMIIGLVVYIGSFLLDVGGDFKQVSEQQDNVREFDPSLKKLLEAEGLLMSDAKGTEHGNTTKAKRIALQYSVALGNLRKEFFTEGRELHLSLTNGVFITYCTLGEDKCAILVHVPQLADYTDEAKELLHDIAWAAAVNTLEKNDPDALNNLAVGIRGALKYDVVLLGDKDGIVERFGHIDGRKTLKDFF
ncbi:hypothetical protein [Rubellicoccus peritrichatus]|uniref:Uncharacterized protein n=1 Tax=Rubellicoccus peritrichatus TaxID=3080537 RepID=A0AAQ3LBB9_9BACT|nr:hypothetical protein [Puniceicoccus sp. CR14]WOO42591.1 hypothetical protein RZN69_05770 [Puniceicoccus sp. CR14]